jgi:hypothetical protein
MEELENVNLPDVDENDIIEDEVLEEQELEEDDLLVKDDKEVPKEVEKGSEGVPISEDFINYLKEYQVEIPEGVTTYEDLVIELVNKQRLNSEIDNETIEVAKLINSVGLDNFIRDYYLGTKELDEQLAQMEQLDDYSVIKAYFIAQGYQEDEAEAKAVRISQRGEEYMKTFRQDIMEDVRKAVEAKKQEIINERLEKLKSQSQENPFLEEYNSFREQISTTINEFEGFDFFPLNDKRKKELFDFVTALDKDGYTYFEKYIQDPKNLLTLAYISMNWDDFMTSLINHYTNGVKEEIFQTIRDVRDETKSRALKPGLISKSIMDEY